MALTDLKKWSMTALKATSVTDGSQIPASSATVDVYRRGATVRVGGTVAAFGGTLAITVYDIGSLVLNDTVKVGTNILENLTVTVVTSATGITVKNDGSSAITLEQYDRLVITNDRPTLYRDATGTQPLPTTGQATSSANGFVEFYTTETRFDYTISGAGFVTTLFTDEEGGQTASQRMEYHVNEFMSLADAISTVPEGAVIWLAGQTYMPTSIAGWTISKALTLRGESTDFSAANSNVTRLAPFNGDKDGVVLTITASNVTIKDLYIGNTADGGVTGAGDGLRIGSASLTSTGVLIENVMFRYNGWNGINVAADGSFTTAIGSESGSFTYNGADKLTIRDCYFSANRGVGIRFWSGETPVIENCWSVGNRRMGVRMYGVIGGTVVGGEFQDNGDDSAEATWDGQLFADACKGLAILGGNFKNFQLNTNKTAIMLRNQLGGCVHGTSFVNSTAIAGTRAVYLGDGTHGVSVSGIRVSNVATAFEVRASDNTTGNFLGSMAVETADAICPASIILPDHTEATASSSGGNVAFIPVTEGDGSYKNYIGAILFPKVSATSVFDADCVQEGMVTYDDTLGMLKTYDGSVFRGATLATKGTAGAPATGTWSVGDMVWNTSGSNLLYICTVAGTPGTWRSIATSP